MYKYLEYLLPPLSNASLVSEPEQRVGSTSFVVIKNQHGFRKRDPLIMAMAEPARTDNVCLQHMRFNSRSLRRDQRPRCASLRLISILQPLTARTGAGGGKPTSQTVASDSNAANDAIWVFSSLFGGVLLNKFGPAYVLAFGAFGFPLYISGFWIYDQTGKAWVPIFMSSLTGVTAGALWATQNWVATFYPEEGQKGKYIFVNWSVSVVLFLDSKANWEDSRTSENCCVSIRHSF